MEIITEYAYLFALFAAILLLTRWIGRRKYFQSPKGKFEQRVRTMMEKIPVNLCASAAVDADGSLYVYAYPPSLNRDERRWETDRESLRLGIDAEAGKFWQDSLIKL